VAKLLMSAYACRPNTGSEPGTGWDFALHAARLHDVWLLTRPDNRPFIDPALVADPALAARLHVTYVAWPGWGRLITDKLVWPRYWAWQRAAAKVAQRLHTVEKFDLAHHVTYVCYWQPAALAEVDRELPFIWGPVGGGEQAPAPLVRDLGAKGWAKELARLLIQRTAEFAPRLGKTARAARIALATTPETAARMTRLGARRIEMFTAVGLADTELDVLARPRPIAPSDVAPPGALRIVSVGRLLDWKGFHLGLRAFAAAKLPTGSRYDVIGDGPMMQRLRALAEALGVSGQVVFHGKVSRDRALELLSSATVMAHPSLHDSGGWVCLEAMAMGKPVLCLDMGGPALQVTDETGIKVPARTPEEAVRGLAAAMKALATDAPRVARLGEAGRRRARDVYSWSVRGRELGRLYDRVLAGDLDASPIGATPGRLSVEAQRPPASGTEAGAARNVLSEAVPRT
jgi:glycosyltransferase involved in cell wall biosynthesis